MIYIFCASFLTDVVVYSGYSPVRRMMQLDHSWEALLNPGNTDEYFSSDFQYPFEVGDAALSMVNAWWLSEFSRLIYRKDSDEGNRDPGDKDRPYFLAERHMHEAYFWKKPDAQCSLIEPDQTNPEQSPFYVLVFRGTNEPTDWITNFNAFLKPWKPGGLVHEGFMNAFLQIWPDIEEVIRGTDLPIFYTGHSLGAALATLAASSLPPNVLYTFGSPRVGNRQFVDTMADLPVFRFVNDHDVVPTVPPSMAMFPFVHVGKPYRLANDVDLEIGNGEAGNREQPSESELADPDSTTLMEKMLNPPGILADHAPVNYVARIERVLKNIKTRVSTGF